MARQASSGLAEASALCNELDLYKVTGVWLQVRTAMR